MSNSTDRHSAASVAQRDWTSPDQIQRRNAGHPRSRSGANSHGPARSDVLQRAFVIASMPC